MSARAVAVTVTAAALALAACRHPGPRRRELAAWREDLALLGRELPKRDPGVFQAITPENWDSAIRMLQVHEELLDGPHQVMAIAGLLARLHDGHTTVIPPPDPLRWPFVAYSFDDGLYIIAGDGPMAEHVGRALVLLGDHPVDVAWSALASVTSADNAQQERSLVADRMSSPTFLVGADIARGAELHVATMIGMEDRKDVTIRPSSWRPGPPPPGAPLWRQRPQASYWATYVPDGHVLYVQYNRCIEARDLSFARFTEQVMATLDANPVERVVVDLRINSGGDSRILAPLTAALQARPALQGRLFVVIGRATFSSGLMGAIDLDRIGAVLVGEPTGQRPSHWGEVKTLVLPHTAIKVSHATRRFEYPDYPGDALAPELPTRILAADYFAGIDPALRAIVATPVPVTGAIAAPSSATPAR